MIMQHNLKLSRGIAFWHFTIGLLLLLFLSISPPIQVTAGRLVFSGTAACPPNLAFGETIHCSIDLTGETDSFGFSGAAGDRIRVRVVTTSGALSPFREIIRPDGTSLCGTVVTEMTCLLDASGVHTLLINDFGGTDTGNYSLYLQRLNEPVGCLPIAFSGVPTNGTIDVAAETDCYTFDGAVNNRIRVRTVAISGALAPFKEVVRADGTTLCGTVTSEITCQIDADGSHTILINDFGATDSGEYQLTLVCLTQPCGAPLNYSHAAYLPLWIRPE